VAEGGKQNLGSTLSAYGLWLVSTALMVLDVLVLRRFLLRMSVALAQRSGGLHHNGPLDHWTVAAVDQFGVLLLGAAGLVLIFVLEGWYTRAGPGLLRRFAKVTGVQVALLALGLL